MTTKSTLPQERTYVASKGERHAHPCARQLMTMSRVLQDSAIGRVETSGKVYVTESREVVEMQGKTDMPWVSCVIEFLERYYSLSVVSIDCWWTSGPKLSHFLNE